MLMIYIGKEPKKNKQKHLKRKPKSNGMVPLAETKKKFQDLSSVVWNLWCVISF